MGSFNKQCAISGETIYEGDEVVSIVLEPNSKDNKIDHLMSPLKSMGQHFKAHTMLLKGDYQGYGNAMFSSPEEQPLSHALALEVYKHGFTENENDEMGWRGHDYAPGGTVSGREHNNLTWFIHKKVFDALIETQSSLSTKESFDKLCSLDHSPFSEKVQTYLSENIENKEAQEMIMLVHAAHELGHNFQWKPSLAEGNITKTYKHRIKLAADLKGIFDNNEDKGTSKFICHITKKAILDGEKVHILPIASRMSQLSSDENMVYMRDRSVAAHYGLSSASIKATYDAESGSFKLDKDLSGRQKRTITYMSEHYNENSEQQYILDALTSSFMPLKKVDRRGGDSIPTHRDFCLISDQAYQALADNKSSISFKDDSAEWIRQAALLTGKFVREAKTQGDLIEILKKNDAFCKDKHYMLPREESYEFVANNSENPSEEKELRYSKQDIIMALERMALDVHHDLDNGFSRKNLFSIMMDGDHTLLDESYSYALRSIARTSLRELFKEEPSQDAFAERFAAFMSISIEFSQDIEILRAMDRFNIPLVPSVRTESAFDANRQIEILSRVSKVATDMIIDRQRDRDEELNY